MAEAVARGLSRSSPGQRSNWLGYFCALTGRRRDALAILDELERSSRREYVSPQSFAVVRLGLGEKDQALSLLEKAYDERAIEWLGFATVLTERLRDEPRFQALVRRMGLHAVGRDPERGARDQRLLRPPEIIIPAPAKMSTPLTMGETVSRVVVFTPSETPPISTPARSLCGIGTNSDATPRIKTARPMTNRAFMASP
jgi:hypothetical protein